ncbi:unnamed protein product [Polarella glacialis]|uniref:Uncharacterized protein n=1 Tax=Polarella glacialis TaxID=89957 RepID=A0A813JDI0_POLGL|nr:unnamed protein product [Polarella glacialis]
MCDGGGACFAVLVALVAVLIGGGLIVVDVDVTPLSSKLGSLLPHPAVPVADGKEMIVKNSDVRAYLASKSLAGPMTQHPLYAEKFPVKGVYYFDKMGSAGVVDFSYLENWNPEVGTFELDMQYTICQTGVPSNTTSGGWGPYLPGGYMLKAIVALSYQNQFSCGAADRMPMQDGDSCTLSESIFGASHESETLGKMGMAWLMTKREGGRVFDRNSWLAPPWATNDASYRSSHAPFHNYRLRRLVDEHKALDEEHYEMLMNKLAGQDLVFLRPDLLDR